MTITPSPQIEAQIKAIDLVIDLPIAAPEPQTLPGSAELPDSDDTPVDNEGQNDIPNGLRSSLSHLWSDRQDWFFGVDMAIYDREGQQNRKPTIVPDGFLALGVIRRKEKLGRRSYVLAEEQNIVPIFALEYLSRTYGGEYDEKLKIYAKLGVLYYVVYNPENRRKHQKLELYELQGKTYQQSRRSPPFWLPKLGLGIGVNQGILSGIPMEWLSWFDHEGTPYPLTEEALERERQRAERQYRRAEREWQRAEREQQRAELLAAKLRELGIDPDTLI